MIISSIELREIRLPLIHFFETSFGRTTERRIILVRVNDADGAEGWGECTAGEGPFYCEEWTETAWPTLKEFLAPMVVGQRGRRCRRRGRFDEEGARPSHGQSGDRNCVLGPGKQSAPACPLWKHLGGVQPEIPCGVSIGIQDSPEELLEKIEKELAAGYQRIKIKIKPGWDLTVVRKVRERYPEILLMGDANSAYTLNDVELFQALDDFNLMMIEQPLAHDDMFDHAELQKQIKTPVCLDESVHSAEDARHAIDIGACRIINVKLGRVGGHAEAKRVETVCRERGNPCLVRRHVGIRHRPRAQYRDGHPGRIYAAGRCLGQRALLGRRHHRAAGDGKFARDDRGAGQAGNWI